jgi:ubiquinone/menaquinone biosynthesis C-methylase UbiE/predicted transcriptional regulator
LKQVIEILKAAGEDTRLRIIALLSQGELSAQEISTVLGQSQPRVSRHLKLLHEAGIIDKRSEGAWVFTKLSNNNKIKSIIDTIINNISESDGVILKDKSKLTDIRNIRKENAQSYFDSIAPEWAKLRKMQQPEELVEETMKSMVANMSFANHVDLGSGMGNILALFADQCGISEGVDNSKGMLMLARSRIDVIGNGSVNVRNGDITELSYPNEYCELATIHQVLHYLDNAQTAIKEAARILKTNGILLIADFAPHAHEILREKYGHKRLGFAINEIKDLAINENLELVDVKTINKTNDNTNNDAELDVIIWKFKKLNNQSIKIDAPLDTRHFA